MSSLTFDEKLAHLCASEMDNAAFDRDRLTDMIERLAHATAVTIVLGTGGHQECIGRMLDGVTAYMLEAAADHQQILKAQLDG